MQSTNPIYFVGRNIIAFLIIFILFFLPFSNYGGVVKAAPLLLPRMQGLSFPAQINKSFDPISVVAGQVSRLSVTIYNPNSFDLADAAYIDELERLQPGIKISDPVNLDNSCNGMVTAVPGGNTLSLSGGSVLRQEGPTPGECTVSIDVVSKIAGNLINTIRTGDLTATGGGGTVSNTSPASATLQVSSVQPPSLSKAFSVNTIFVGATSRLTITLRNNDLLTPLTKVNFTDTLPLGVVLAPTVDPVPSGCGGGAITAFSGLRNIILDDATIAANTVCTVAVNVTSSTQDTYTNGIPAGAISSQQGVSNATLAEAVLAVQNVGITKTFSPTSIVAGAVSTLTITIKNPTSNAYTGVKISDSLPGDLIISGAGATTNCGAGVLEYPDGVDNNLTPGGNEKTIRLTGGTVPASTNPPTTSNCIITVPVTSTPNATVSTWTNTIYAKTLETAELITNPSDVSATLAVTRWLTGTKVFLPASIPTGGTSTVTIALRNNRINAALNNVSFTDVMPNNNLTILGTPTISPIQCGGSVTFTNPPLSTPAQVIVTGVTIAANSTCNIIYQVTSSVVGNSTNTIPAGNITTTEGASNVLITSNSLGVVSAGGPVRVAKAFQTSPISPGTTVRLRITITSPTDIGVSGINFTDVLPVGLDIVTSPAKVNGCGGVLSTLITPVGQDEISLVGGFITNPNTACTIDVYVSSQTAGSYLNTIGINGITTTELRTNSAGASSNLIVSGFTMSKAFYPTGVNANGISTLTISLTNTSPAPITNLTLLDDLSIMGGTSPTDGVYIASVASSNCGEAGTFSFQYPDGTDNSLGANERKIRLVGGTIPAKVGVINGLCTINVDVQGRGAAVTRTNTIPITNVNGLISGSPISPRAQAQNTLTIGNLTITVNKGFLPLKVTGGSSSKLSVTLNNPNSVALAGINFTDTMPAGMTIANPPNLSKGTCNSDSDLTGAIGGNSFSFSNGKLAAATSCKFSLDTTTNVNGNLTNTIPALSVTTSNGATNPQPAEASLTNLPGASVSKAFAPNPVIAQAGGHSVLTITIQNTGNVPLTGMGLIDNLPASLSIAGAPAPAPVTHCGGMLTAVAGTQLIKLENGSLAGSSTCTIVVSVSGNTPGNFQNCIAVNALTNNENVQNHEAACDTLKIDSLIDPPLGLKVLNAVGLPELEWRMVWINNSNATGINVQISDPIPTGSAYVLGSIVCEARGNSSTNTCDYEAANGRIFWQGIIGPDLGAANEADALNEVVITFRVTVSNLVNYVENQATSLTDRDGDGSFTDETDTSKSDSNVAVWGILQGLLPGTGFAPGIKTILPNQSLENPYLNYSDLTLEIPSLNIRAAIVGVPIKDKTWDIRWLGSNAGWLNGTAFPTWAGNSVITGHVWNADNTSGPFLNLKNLGWGDLVIIHAYGQKYIYQVQSIATIKPDSVSSAMKHEVMPWVTLLTCADFNEKTGSYLNRVIVRAVQVRIEVD